MKPDNRAQYSVKPSLDNVVVFLVARNWLEKGDLLALAAVDVDYEVMIESVPKLMALDFSPLRLPRKNYEDQAEIPKSRIRLMGACAIHYGLDMGLVTRYLGNEYTATNRDVKGTIDELAPHIDKDDLDHIKRILSRGCPHTFSYEEERESKIRMLRRGNQKSVSDNMDIVNKAMNKEERYSHVAPFPRWIVRFSWTAHHVPQGMNIKTGKNPRLVWDGSTKRAFDDIVMNDLTPTDDEAPITFGNTKKDVMSYIYNTRISYPKEEILLAAADVKACFRFPRIHADLTGAFGFVIAGIYYLATAMVFGSIASASSWEAFRRAIELMTAVFFNKKGLEEKHKELMEMIEWDTPPPPGTIMVKARPCQINKGVLDKKGNQLPIPGHIYVDDCLIVAMGIPLMRKALLGVIEAIFTVMGFPDTTLRQCPLALDKWKGMKVSHEMILLGLVFNTRTMRIGITPEYQEETLNLINREWHQQRKSFSIKDIELLAGKLGRLGEGAVWVYHLMSHIYSSIAFALSENKQFLLDTSHEFRRLIKETKKTESSIMCINFAVKQAAQLQHKCTRKYFINSTLKEEINILRQCLGKSSGVVWSTPFAHMIKRSPSASSLGDACLYGGGGFSIGLRFWWHILWPTEIYHRTKKFVQNNKKGKLISINVLEFATIIINYAAAITAIKTGLVTLEEHPTLLNFADNTSSVRWTNHACKSSLAGRALGRLFCSLLMDSPLGINCTWISTHENVIADDISRVKKESNEKNIPNKISPTFDYSTLQQRYPQLIACLFFQPSQEFLSLIWQAMLTKNSPDPTKLSQCKQNGLGKLITSASPNDTKSQTHVAPTPDTRK